MHERCAVPAEAVAAGQAGVSPDPAVSAGHPQAAEAPPDPGPPCRPFQAHLPCRQEGQEGCRRPAGQLHHIPHKLACRC